MMQTMTDIDIDVDAVFDELECVSRRRTSHDGEKFAWAEQHDCYQGWICEGHYREWMDRTYPRNQRIASINDGKIMCTECGQWFNLNEYVKMTVL